MGGYRDEGLLQAVQHLTQLLIQRRQLQESIVHGQHGAVGHLLDGYHDTLLVLVVCLLLPRTPMFTDLTPALLLMPLEAGQVLELAPAKVAAEELLGGVGEGVLLQLVPRLEDHGALLAGERLVARVDHLVLAEGRLGAEGLGAEAAGLGLLADVDQHVQVEVVGLLEELGADGAEEAVRVVALVLLLEVRLDEVLPELRGRREVGGTDFAGEGLLGSVGL